MLVAGSYYVYFIINKNKTVLYTGVTNSLERRIWEHKVKFNATGFSARYNCDKLVYYEVFEDINYAIDREKQLKNWKREWKNALVEKENKEWKDLAAGWFTKDELDYP